MLAPARYGATSPREISHSSFFRESEIEHMRQALEQAKQQASRAFPWYHVFFHTENIDDAARKMDVLCDALRRHEVNIDEAIALLDEHKRRLLPSSQPITFSDINKLPQISRIELKFIAEQQQDARLIIKLGDCFKAKGKHRLAAECYGTAGEIFRHTNHLTAATDIFHRAADTSRDETTKGSFYYEAAYAALDVGYRTQDPTQKLQALRIAVNNYTLASQHGRSDLLEEVGECNRTLARLVREAQNTQGAAEAL